MCTCGIEKVGECVLGQMLLIYVYIFHSLSLSLDLLASQKRKNDDDVDRRRKKNARNLMIIWARKKTIVQNCLLEMKKQKCRFFKFRVLMRIFSSSLSFDLNSGCCPAFFTRIIYYQKQRKTFKQFSFCLVLVFKSKHTL